MSVQVLFYLLMTLRISGDCQPEKNTYHDVGLKNERVQKNLIKKKLPVYNATFCIQDLLKQIVDANREFYKPQKYFYSLSFKDDKDKKYIVIEAVRYNVCSASDYVCAIKISEAVFLCRGNITTEPLFKRNGDSYIYVQLEKKESPDNYMLGWEPSLRGLYQECKNNTIYIEIYTRAAPPGYKMEK